MDTLTAPVLLQWKALLLLGFPAFIVIITLALFLWNRGFSKESPFRGAVSPTEVGARLVFSLGDTRPTTPYLPFKTMHSTIGVQIGVASIIGVMCIFLAQPLVIDSGPFGNTGDPKIMWGILAVSLYQLIWIKRFYVKYDDKTLETIDWLHRKRIFHQDELVALRVRSNNQTYRLQYETGHISVLMYLKGREEFLTDMERRIANNLGKAA